MNPSHDSSLWCIALLAGGDSDEAVISRRSGAAVQAALSSRGHIVVHLDPAVVDLEGVDWRQFDVAFLALHGRFGEDGQVQEVLERAGIPYTGSDAATSRLAFSKSAAKERLALFGVATPPYALVHYSDQSDRLQRMVEHIGYPLVVKPDTQGSSLGITIVRHPRQFDDALRRCFEFDSFGIVERFIEGTEWTVGLLDDLILPPICIETPRAFFDYQAKYEDEATRYLFDTDWSASDLEQLRDTALATCRALGARGLVRVDFRADRERTPWVLEVNTIPGLTDHSLVPKAAARMGIDFAELCERAIRASLRGAAPRPHHLQNRIIRRAAG
ncbi:MAG: D-alanine--D-alanine ligase [Planctomycetaceae bacterium]|nr:D-alanine--D-alanine ligase [Planctomycetaceae bacterium]